ncbi:O-antigen ligase family protein [Zhongshania sp.]|uniref:O-antigen ligase family protein n=1 Tax=Zhongshania sp. TaxID=1971902 RepID=UPI0035679E43
MITHNINFHNKSQKDLQYAICLLIIWLPLPLGSNRPWSGGIAITLISAIALIWTIRKRRHSLEISAPLKNAKPAVISLVLVQLLAAVQYLTGISLAPSESFNYLLLGTSYTLLFILTLDLFVTRQSINLLLATVIFNGTLQAFYGSSMTLSNLEWSFFEAKEHMHGLATGTFVNRNHLAGYLEISAACCIGLLLALRDQRPISIQSILNWISGPKPFLRIALAIMVIGLVMTKSRMGNIAFLSSMIITGGILAVASPKLRPKLFAILSSLLIIDVFIVAKYFGLEELKMRLISTQLNDKVVAGEVLIRQNVNRDEVFNYTIPLLNKYAFHGSGAGSFETIFPSVAGRDISHHFTHAHNDYIQFAIEYGFFGGASLIYFYVFTYYHGINALTKLNSAYRSGVGFACVMAMTAIAIHSLTDFNLQIPANAATITVISALGLLARFHTRPH